MIEQAELELEPRDAAATAKRIGLVPHRGCVVIILNYGGIVDTRECLDSLRVSGAPPESILVVDNGSKGDDAERLCAEFPDVPLVRMAQNTGFCGGNNIGAALARSAGASHVVLLNNDTTVEPGFLDTICDYFEQHEDVALLNPKIVWYHAPGRLWFAGGTYSPWLAFPRDPGRNKVDGPPFDTEREVTFTTGCVLGIRLDAVPYETLFVPEFFGYAEDLELTLRVRGAGGRAMYAPITTVRHKEGRTFALLGRRHVAATLSCRNMMMVARRYLRWYQWPTALLSFAFLYIARLAFLYAFRDDWGAAGALVAGTVEGLVRRPLPPLLKRRR